MPLYGWYLGGKIFMVVNSVHHQAVHPDHIGKELRVAALAAEGVIEALESERKRFLLGLQ